MLGKDTSGNLLGKEQYTGGDAFYQMIEIRKRQLAWGCCGPFCPDMRTGLGAEVQLMV